MKIGGEQRKRENWDEQEKRGCGALGLALLRMAGHRDSRPDERARRPIVPRSAQHATCPPPPRPQERGGPVAMSPRASPGPHLCRLPPEQPRRAGGGGRGGGNRHPSPTPRPQPPWRTPHSPRDWPKPPGPWPLWGHAGPFAGTGSLSHAGAEDWPQAGVLPVLGEAERAEIPRG